MLTDWVKLQGNYLFKIVFPKLVLKFELSFKQ